MDVEAELKKLLEKDLDKIDATDKPHRRIRPVRIRYKGKFLVMPSGKTIWRRIGDAKAALLVNNFFDPVYYSHKHGGYCLRWDNSKAITWDEAKEYRALYKELLFSTVEFVEFDS